MHGRKTPGRNGRFKAGVYDVLAGWGWWGRFGVLPNCSKPQSHRSSRSGINVWPEGVGDLGRRGAHNGSADDTILFQSTKLRGENSFAHGSEKIAEFGEAQRTKGKAPHRLDFSLAAQRTLMVA